MNDLQIFKRHFLSDKVKEYNDRLEYHGQNIDRDLMKAKTIIERQGLDLIARTTGNMAAQKRFEVIIKD